jgi:hypothetical protein
MTGATLISFPTLARKGVIAALLCLIATPAIVPLGFSDFHSNLPDCCRRNGKHHCDMTLMGATESPGFTAASPKCPLFPKLVSVRQGMQLYPVAVREFGKGLVNQPAPPAQAEIVHGVSSARAHPKRGPPAIPSLG